MESKITGVILAAGGASRMGQTKQLLPWKGGTILGRVIREALASRLDRVVLVLGHDRDRILDRIDTRGIRTVLCKNWRLGQAESLKQGLAAVPDDSRGAMFLLGDQPLVTAGVIDSIIRAFLSSDAVAAIPVHRGRRGNPVLLARSLFPRIQTPTGDTGPRVLFPTMETGLVRVEIPDRAILLDIDTPGDYEALAASRDGSTDL